MRSRMMAPSPRVFHGEGKQERREQSSERRRRIDPMLYVDVRILSGDWSHVRRSVLAAMVGRKISMARSIAR